MIPKTKAVSKRGLREMDVHVDISCLHCVIVGAGVRRAIAEHSVEVVANQAGGLLLKSSGNGLGEVADVGQIDVVGAVIHAEIVTFAEFNTHHVGAYSTITTRSVELYLVKCYTISLQEA